jgi:hypothetical protein
LNEAEYLTMVAGASSFDSHLARAKRLRVVPFQK